MQTQLECELAALLDIAGRLMDWKRRHSVQMWREPSYHSFLFRYQNIKLNYGGPICAAPHPGDGWKSPWGKEIYLLLLSVKLQQFLWGFSAPQTLFSWCKSWKPGMTPGRVGGVFRIWQRPTWLAPTPSQSQSTFCSTHPPPGNAHSLPPPYL